VVGIDDSAAQLATARQLQRVYGLAFTLMYGNAERVPSPDTSFDLAISEYGACLWADPSRWVPEAARVLRPGGALIFLVSSALLMLCMPEAAGLAASDRLLRPACGMDRIAWPGETGVAFHPSHGDWLRLLRRSGFELEDLIGIQALEAGTTRYPYVTLPWAHQWPSEEIWKARRWTD
jgi:SAM-dependent methyltransferase